MKKLRILAVIACALLTNNPIYAQKKDPSIPLTADSLATGNYKDVFKSFFQLAFDRFTSNDKALEFTSNPFAIMAKMNPGLLIDTNYLKYTHLRNLNFSFSAKLDSVYRFNGFSSGIKYALINQRDETVSKSFVISAFNANDEFNRLNTIADKYISTITIRDPQRAIMLMDQKNKMFAGDINFSQLDTSLQGEIKRGADSLHIVNFLRLVKKDPDLNIGKLTRGTYDSLKTLFQNRLLWTLGISDTTYQDQFLFSNLVLSSDLLKGISNPLKPLGAEIDLRGRLNFVDDTLKAGHDLHRIFLQFEPGLNFFLKTKSTQYPWAEFKLSGSYVHNFAGIYSNESKDSLSINATLRIRIINDIWIPLEIRYDPKSGNVFGLINVRFNFSGLGKPAKS